MEDKEMKDENAEIVRGFYDSQVQFEWDRIVGKPEFLLTCRMLDRYIEPGDTVLDIGGGPGRYTFYLAQKGCDVTLLDFSPENISFADQYSVDSGLNIQTICGDAREADVLVKKQFDHVLLMGPLYHLLEENERVKAVNSALKVLKPGGLLFASFINMSGGLVFMLREVPEQFANPDEERFLIPLVANENYGGRAFTQAFFINQHNVLPFMSQFPIKKSICSDKRVYSHQTCKTLWINHLRCKMHCSISLRNCMKRKNILAGRSI
jgi:2-polyprenyl-3-methyl-5-hydroxy-6-metoxy-1,4-benzoquinol methylase